MIARVAAALLFAATAEAAVSPTMTRQYPGLTNSYNQVACSTNTAIVPDNGVLGTPPYPRLSILIKNCAALGGNDVAVCMNSTTCATGAGFILGPREGLWLDWSTGPISCTGIGGTVTVCYLEERG
jgi:hypothetical protein